MDINKNYIAIILIGYFAIKIIYSLFFNIYSNKYYDKNYIINTTSENNINLNSFTPGLWNNEMTDVITLIVLIIIINIFTPNFINSIFSDNFNTNYLIGYIIGLTYPILRTYSNPDTYFKSVETKFNIKIRKYLYLILIVISIIFIYFLTKNANISNTTINYYIYILIIIVILFGLYISKKNDIVYQKVNINYGNCNNIQKYMVSSHDKLNITLPFISLILLLFFDIDTNSDYILVYYIHGILLGILVSGISYYGFEYFLSKYPITHCNDIDSCLSIFNNQNDLNKLKSKKSRFKIVLIYMISLIFILLLIYFYLKFSNN